MSNEDELRRKAEKPQVQIREIAAVCNSLFGITIDETKSKELDSYDDRNFYVRTKDTDTPYTLKIHNGVESDRVEQIEAQNLMLVHLQENGINCCSPVKDRRGGLTAFHEFALRDGTTKRHAIRLLNWVEGSIMHDVPLTPALVMKAGIYLGRLSHVIQEFDHEGVHRLHSWDLQHTLLLRDFFKHITEPARVALVSSVVARFEATVAPAMKSGQLVRCIIQGDFNDANIIVSQGEEKEYEVTGVIDFGDTVHTLRVNELAIAMAYMMVNVATAIIKEMGGKDMTEEQEPAARARLLDVGRTFFSGFATATTLSGYERAVLPTLVACRLAMSCTYGALSISKDPTNEYLQLHAVPGWLALRLYWSCEVDDELLVGV